MTYVKCEKKKYNKIVNIRQKEAESQIEGTSYWLRWRGTGVGKRKVQN